MSVIKKRYLAYSLLLLNSALWGFSPPIIKNAFNYVNPISFLFFRYLLAAFAFFPVFLIYRTRKKRQINLKHHILCAILGTPLTLLPLFYGLSATTAIESSIIESLTPIFVVIGGIVYLKEKVTSKEWLGAIVALCGSLLLVVQPLLFGNHQLTPSFYGNLLIVLSNIIWAAFLIISKQDHLDPTYLTFFSFLVSIPFFLLTSLITHTPLQISTPALPAIFYMAIFGSIVAFWAYQEAQKHIEASEAAIFSYLKPLFTLPLAYFWLKEPLGVISLLSLGIISLGVLLSEKT